MPGDVQRSELDVVDDEDEGKRAVLRRVGCRLIWPEGQAVAPGVYTLTAFVLDHSHPPPSSTACAVTMVSFLAYVIRIAFLKHV